MQLTSEKRLHKALINISFKKGHKFSGGANMEYLKNEFGTIKQMVSSLTLDERTYLRYLRAKQMARQHWVNKRYRKVG